MYNKHMLFVNAAPMAYFQHVKGFLFSIKVNKNPAIANPEPPYAFAGKPFEIFVRVFPDRLAL